MKFSFFADFSSMCTLLENFLFPMKISVLSTYDIGKTRFVQQLKKRNVGNTIVQTTTRVRAVNILPHQLLAASFYPPLSHPPAASAVSRARPG